MKHLLLTTIAAVLLVGCGKSPTQQSSNSKPTTAISIHDAAKSGNIDAVNQHLATGADVNAKTEFGWTPLHFATEWGQKEVAELLIAKGADVNAKDEDRNTPLHLAALFGRKEVIELLIANGAAVNVKGGNLGGMPLHHAAFEGHKVIIELLIAEGADVNAIIVSGPLQFNVGDIALNFTTDSEIAALLRKHGGMTSEELRSGMTPLHLAAVNGHKEIVELLIAKGADVNEKIASGSNKNKTPLDFAVIKKQNETANLLRTHGGKTAEELALMPRLVQRGPREFSFLVKKAKIYEVQSSFNLLNWEVIKTYNQHGPRILFEDERDFEPQKIFYRVKVVE